GAVAKFRMDLPDISLGSVRIRIAPNGKVGLWLDLPNVTVKELLDERQWFERTLKWAYIEIGQKRKKLEFINGKHHLIEEKNKKWFETYLGKNLKAFPIYGKVGEFTQPGFRANKKLIQTVGAMVEGDNLRVLELCSGSGNFSFHLASMNHHVTAVEVDETSIQAMKKSLEDFENKNLIEITKVNLHGKDPKIKMLFEDKDIVLADPPRSGLGKSLDVLSTIKDLPAKFIYVSCFPESFLKDISSLKELGYELKRIEAVDQFPQSKHIELIGLLELVK
ncbi:MAG: RsmD family RNA methyltransferase, partial [Bdellovibrionales bacterium]|nr:RsmD family RNA methyltransferase [Bdellovibrionales bacterium]